MAAPTPAPLNRERHAALVAYLLRNKPGAHRVLFNPTQYLFDERDRIRGVDIELRAGELRVAFNSETDWKSAMELIRTLLALDAEACLMSIGTRIDGRDYYGNYVGADRPRLEDLVMEREAESR